MSYDVYVACERCGSDLMCGGNNLTSNLAAMWDKAGAPLRDWNGKKAYEVLPSLAGAIRRLRDDDEDWESLEPDNGWGTCAQAIQFLERIRDACCRDPFGTVHVSC